MERDRQSSSQSLRSASHGAAGETDTATRLAAVAVPDHLVYTSDNEPGILRQAPIGIFRRVERPAYDDLVRDQIRTVEAEDQAAAIAAMIAGKATWEADER